MSTSEAGTVWPSGVIAPEAHGATGDGTTVDHRAITEAANAAATFGADLLLTAEKYNTGTSSLWLPEGLTVRGRSLIEGGSPGISAVNVRSRTTLQGIAVRNPSTSYSFAVSVIAGSDDVTLNRVRFPAANGVGVYLNNAGISNVTVERCVFDGLTFGVLSNSGMGNDPLRGAYDLRDVTVDRCVFTDISGDGIEINHPYGEGAAGTLGPAHTFTLTRNIIFADRGSGRTAGFGIGVAGASNVKIVGNTITARYEGIHVEDDARDVIVRDNTIVEVAGDDAYAGIHILASCVNVKIVGNTVRNVTGPRVSAAILVSYDARPMDSRHVTVTDNTVENSGRDGIAVMADNGGNFRVYGNTILDVARDGILLGGGLGFGFHVYENTVTGAGGYGFRIAQLHALNAPHTIRENTISGAALGETNFRA